MTAGYGDELAPTPSWADLLGAQNMPLFRPLRRVYLVGRVLPLPVVGAIYLVAAATHTDLGTSLWPLIAALVLASFFPIAFVYPLERFGTSLASRAASRLDRYVPPLRLSTRKAVMRWCARVDIDWRDLADAVRPTGLAAQS